MQCFFSGGREQLVENTGRELPSQHRTVGDNAIGVVDKRYAVNPSYGVDPENSVDTFRFEQLSELVPCVMRAHGVFDRLPQTIILFLAVAFGVEGLQSVIGNLPAWVMSGLSAASGMMTGVGFAILTSMIWDKEIGGFFFVAYELLFSQSFNGCLFRDACMPKSILRSA